MPWITIFLPIKKWAYALKLLKTNGKAFRICLPSTSDNFCRLQVREDGMPFIHAAQAAV